MTGKAQEDRTPSNIGLLRGSATIAPGFMLNAPVTDIYLSGKLEYFPEERISFRGESFWYVDSQRGNSLMARNSQISFGPFYHIGHDRLDLALGFEPGISLAKPAIPVPLAEAAPLRGSPHVALCAGMTYAVWDHLDFFVDARYVHASYRGAPMGSIPLDEVIIGGGLGFHLRVK